MLTILIALTAVNIIALLISILLNIRATFLVKRAQTIQKNTYGLIANSQEAILKFIPKAIVNTLSILTSDNEEAKDQLRKITEEE